MMTSMPVAELMPEDVLPNTSPDDVLTVDLPSDYLIAHCDRAEIGGHRRPVVAYSLGLFKPAIVSELDTEYRYPDANRHTCAQADLDMQLEVHDIVDADEVRSAAVLDMRAGQRPLRTFQSDELENDFLSYCQMASPVVLSATELETRRAELLKLSGDYIHLDDFNTDCAEQQICGSTLLEPVGELEEGMQRGMEDLMFAKLCTRRLLGKAEETSAVKRLHYFKFLAHQLLSGTQVDQWAVARAEGLVRASLWHRALVIQSNMRLVVSIVRKLPVSPYHYDELVSDGILGMVRALDRFDPCRGYRFCTYATTVIRRECFQHIQDQKLQRRRFGNSAVLTVLNAVRGLSEVPRDRTHWISWRRKLAVLLNELTPREQVIIRSRYCLGDEDEVCTLQRLAELLNVSKERIRQLERNALAKLKSLATTMQFDLDDALPSESLQAEDE